MTRKDFAIMADILVSGYRSVWIKDADVNTMLKLTIKKLKADFPNFDEAKFHAYIVKELQKREVA